MESYSVLYMTMTTMIMMIIIFIVFIILYKTIKLLILVYRYQKRTNSSLLIICDIRTGNWFNQCWNYIKYKICPFIIDINDYKSFLKWYKQCSRNKNLDIILNTNGGDAFSSDIVWNCLMNHQGRINVYIPRYAMSAGSFLALCGNTIYMNYYACMGPIDPILCFEHDDYSYMDIKKLIDEKGTDEVKDEYLLGLFSGKKIYDDGIENCTEIIHKKHEYVKNKSQLINAFASGQNYHHDKIFNTEFLKRLGLKINLNFPPQIQHIFDSSIF